jgi:hypothetical protein
MAFLQDHPETVNRVNQVAKLIQGFETPYSMELLATVLWLVQEENADQSLATITQEFVNWNKRKQERFRKDHIEIAWNKLQQEQLV